MARYYQLRAFNLAVPSDIMSLAAVCPYLKSIVRSARAA